MGSMFHGDRFCLDDEKPLGIDNGDGYTISWLYLLSLNGRHTWKW